MSIIRILDKPDLKLFNDVALLATDKHDAKDYQVSGDGLAKIISDRIVYDTICSSAVDAVEKKIVIEGFTEKVPGMMIWITFENGNTAPKPTLSINDNAAAPLQVKGKDVPVPFIQSGEKYKIEYIGDAWNIVNQAYSKDEFLSLKNLHELKEITDFNAKEYLSSGTYFIENLKNSIKNGPSIISSQKNPENGILEISESKKIIRQKLSWVNKGDTADKDVNYSLTRTLTLSATKTVTRATKWTAIAELDTAGKPLAAREDNPINKGYAIWDEASKTFKTTKDMNFDSAHVIGNLNVEGSITQSGEGYISHLEDLKIKDNTITLREGASTSGAGLGPTEYSGLVMENYDGQKNNMNLVVDAKGEARLGKTGKLEPLMTRAEQASMEDKGVIIWNNSKRRAETLIVPDGSKDKVLTYNGKDTAPTFKKMKFTPTWTGTKAQYEIDKKITDPNSDNYIPDNSIVNITDDALTWNLSTEAKEGDLNPITSDAVYKLLRQIIPIESLLPVGTIIENAGNKAPKGFLPCDGREITQAQYPELYKILGTAYDPNGAKCLLPNFRDKYSIGMGTQQGARFIPESLPNIKGNTLSKQTGTSTTFSSANDNGDEIVNKEGNAFDFDLTDPKAKYGGTCNTSGRNRPLTFDAHKSNPVYQDGAKVRPDSLQVYKYIKY